LKKSSSRIYQKYKDTIVDIILFGSAVKGSLKPNDIDVAVILKKTDEYQLADLRSEFNFENSVHLNLVLMENIFDTPLFKVLLSEGISLLDGKTLRAKLGVDAGTIFSVNLVKLQKSKKVLFYYALQGKKGIGGLLENVKGKLIGRSVVFIPVEYVAEFKDFLESWNVDYYRMDVLRL